MLPHHLPRDTLLLVLIIIIIITITVVSIMVTVNCSIVFRLILAVVIFHRSIA